ncbi:MAG: hypothetical protein IH944_09340 [Armatimonadetes bacterium]|nr:hypothetical protein [Armatimonadota bacterium]
MSAAPKRSVASAPLSGGSIWIKEVGQPMPLSRDYRITVAAMVAPNSYTWFTIR